MLFTDVWEWWICHRWMSEGRKTSQSHDRLLSGFAVDLGLSLQFSIQFADMDMIANIPLSIPLIERGFGCIPKNCARFCPSTVLDPWSNFTITFWQGTWGLPSVHFFMRWMWWMILHLGSTFDGWNPNQFGSSLWNYLKGLFSHPRWWPEIWGINSFSIDAHEWDDQHGHSVVKVLWNSYILKLFCHPLETAGYFSAILSPT